MTDSNSNLQFNLWQEIEREIGARRALVAATVVRSSGSVPRRAGAKMLVYADGRTRGTVGGGIFESLVLRDALSALEARQSVARDYSFNPSDPNESSDEAARNGARRNGARRIGAVCGGRAEVFLEVLMPPDRLLIVGGGHCGRALAEAASLLDLSIVLVDDRAEFAQPADYPFSGVEQVLHLPANMDDLPIPDAATYVVLVSKGFRTDEAALRRVLDSPAPYIGMIGSIRKREVVFDALRAEGVPGEKLARVQAPIGLEIGAETPAEIAVSILAQIVQVRAAARQAAARQKAAS